MNGDYTTDEILGMFCATKPLPARRGGPQVAVGQAKHARRVAAKLEEEEERRRREEATSRESEVSGPLATGYYQRFASLQQSMEATSRGAPLYNTAPIDEEGEEEEEDAYFGPGKPMNPSAKPGDDDYLVEHSEDLYSGYSFETNRNPDLPIARHKEHIMSTIQQNQVTIIQGSTGSGKSTQVPQYILEEFANKNQHCNIVCTQPRRIAATSVARFVAQSRGWKLGSLVGYQIGMDKNVSEDSRLTFVTTGVLLEKLINMKNMNQFTHVILDEVHERDRDTDFCLLVVRKLLRTNSKHVKVILMSATFETDMFAQYFAMKLSDQLHLAPVVSVEGQAYTVQEFFLDEIKHLGSCHDMDEESPRISEEAMKMACQLVTYFDELEAHDPNYGKGDFVRGTVLVFLPGLPEIQNLDQRLPKDHLNLTLIPLHSSITTESQNSVFLKPQHGKRKVILATNIAESSITVPDIKYVIDFCLVKQLVCDPDTNYTCLQTVLASQASLKQRRGRAGRVSAGRCYRLISRDYHERYVPDYSTPEMLRCPLETIILKTKKLDLGEPKAILIQALQPPNPEDMERALLTLKEVGAITVLDRGRVNPYDGQLTFVGEVLESLPVDVRVGKLLILSYPLGCLEECLVIAAGLSVKSFFVRPYLLEISAYKSQMAWAESSFSDCIAILNAYVHWHAFKTKACFTSKQNEEWHWCRRNLINYRAINEVGELVLELSKRLARYNICPQGDLLKKMSNRAAHHKTLLLKLVVAGAFYPNYFHWGESDEELNQKAMSGHDPATTVMVCGLPANPENYARELSEMFKECGVGKALHFEGQKVFIEFERPRPSRQAPISQSHPVLEAVYLALKMHFNRKRLTLRVKEGGTRGGAHRGEELFPTNEGIKPVPLPDSERHQIVVTEVVDAGHFWAQFGDIETNRVLQELMNSINQRPLTPLTVDPSRLFGHLCLARYSEDHFYYRAKVEDYRGKMAQVVFIDYGNVECVPIEQLCRMTQEDYVVPAQAFECYLASVRSSYAHSSDGCWSLEATRYFTDLCKDRHLIAKVYSRLKNTLRVELFDTTGENDVLINQSLVAAGYAIKSSEPYASRLARAQAVTRTESEASQTLTGVGRGKWWGRQESGEPQEKRMDNYVIKFSKTVPWGGSYASPSLKDGPRSVTLKGPENPYQVSFYAMTNVGAVRPARIDQSSVNSIVINNEPQDKHERLMVATHVALNAHRSTCLARNTTLMPNIPGLPHLVAMLFAPTIEMRTDQLKRQYTGVLCGLGHDPRTGESLYHEHDMELTFDTLFTNEDLLQINQVRASINTAVGSEDDVAQWGAGAIRHSIQPKIRALVLDLILKPRVAVTSQRCSHVGWNHVAPQDLLLPSSSSSSSSVDEGTGLQQQPPLLSLHSGVDISGERIDEQRSTRVLLLRKEMERLRQKASHSQVPERLTCELCNVLCSCPAELQAHLETRGHTLAERSLFKDDTNLDLSADQLSKMAI